MPYTSHSGAPPTLMDVMLSTLAWDILLWWQAPIKHYFLVIFKIRYFWSILFLWCYVQAFESFGHVIISRLVAGFIWYFCTKIKIQPSLNRSLACTMLFSTTFNKLNLNNCSIVWHSNQLSSIYDGLLTVRTITKFSYHATALITDYMLFLATWRYTGSYRSSICPFVIWDRAYRPIQCLLAIFNLPLPTRLLACTNYGKFSPFRSAVLTPPPETTPLNIITIALVITRFLDLVRHPSMAVTTTTATTIDTATEKTAAAAKQTISSTNGYWRSANRWPSQPVE